jgi:hypothetical protein
MHETMTVDVVVMLEGDLEMHLDSGESSTLHADDTVVQRVTAHRWQNITSNNGRAHFLACFLPVEQPVAACRKKLATESL